ncbi:uncharacterized protein B0P05DRAFT_525280 [Gilbertella persicaria]|uniref:uncharacterized protein n=1 Tax=Gilbertella persicaria TaxID=101096 RepID=UPI002220D316|nr:uncharacterized protein B0P05DRAFT_525280 [Gilbertella persicaria]KAI8092211.1 hypothetical protein B0P05DRAFT_525280 [Gilbertella persicaria]
MLYIGRVLKTLSLNSIKFKMSNTPITKKDASNIQSMAAHEGQDTGKGSTAAAAQSFGDKNFEAAKEATSKGFSTQSNYDEDTTKPDTPMKN